MYVLCQKKRNGKTIFCSETFFNGKQLFWNKHNRGIFFWFGKNVETCVGGNFFFTETLFRDFVSPENVSWERFSGVVVVAWHPGRGFLGLGGIC